MAFKSFIAKGDWQLEAGTDESIANKAEYIEVLYFAERCSGYECSYGRI